MVCSCIQRASLPTCLCSKGWGGGGRPQHVLPITCRIWKGKSELEEVRVRLPTWQGKGSRSMLEISSPVGPSCDSPSACKHGERREAGREPRQHAPLSRELHAGSVLQSHCRLGGDRFTPGDTAEFPGSAGLELLCKVLGKGAGEKQREKSRCLQEFRWRHSTACQAVCHIQAI